jgi:hypothetical protein
LVGNSSLRATLAVVAQLNAFIGNDTAIRHAAVASDTLSIGLFGPTSCKKWGNERPPRHMVLSSESGKMDDISVEAVLEILANWEENMAGAVTGSKLRSEDCQPRYLAAESRKDRSVSDVPLVLERSLNE